MAVTAAALRRAGIRLSPDAFEALVAWVVEETGRTGRAVLAEPALPPAEAAALARAGLVDGPLPPGATDPVALMAARYATLLASSLSVGEAAARLGVNPTRVRQRLTARTLYGFKHGREWRLPAFQFTERGAVPGIEVVFPHLDPDDEPVGVENWFTLPSPELELDGRLMSPRDWLLAGQSPAAVAEVAAGLYP